MARRAGLGRGDRPALDVLVPAQPGRHARDDRRPRGRRRRVQVRDDRDRGDRRSSDGSRRTPAARSGRAASTCTSARSSAPSTPGATRSGAGSPSSGSCGGGLASVRHARCRRRLPGPAAGRAGPEPGPVRARAPRRCSTRVPDDRRPTRLAIEPGRALVARAGWLVARVLHVRERGGRQVVIDAGMTELIRPALYGARHPIVALTSARAGRSTPTGARPRARADPRRRPDLRVDRRARHRTTCRRSAAATSSPSPTPARMPPRSSSTYNGRPRPPQVFLERTGACASPGARRS